MGADRPDARYDPLPALAGVVAVLLPLALYLRTMAPTVYGVDSAELTTGAYLMGIVHPPGAPTYLLLAHLFTWLPFGDVGYRVNLLSALATGCSLFLHYRIALRLHCPPALAAAVTVFVGVGYFIWASAVAAEIYAVQGCVALALVLLGLHWREADRPGTAVAFGLLFGLGLGVHASLVLLAPGLCWLVLGGTPGSRPKPLSLAWCGFAAVLGASVYVYLPLRYLADLPLNPARDSWQVDLTTIEGLWWMVTARGYAHLFFAGAESGPAAALAGFLFQLWSNFIGLGAVLGICGIVAGLRADRSVHLALATMVGVYLLFYLPYGAGDTYMMFVPVFLLFGVWIAIGADWLLERVAPQIDALPPSKLAAILVAGLAATAIAINYPLLDISADTSARDRGRQLIDTLPPETVFFGTFPDLRVVEYLQYVEGARGDIVPIDLHFDPVETKKRRIEEALAGSAPVYVSACGALGDAPWRCEPMPDCDCGRISALD